MIPLLLLVLLVCLVGVVAVLHSWRIGLVGNGELAARVAGLAVLWIVIVVCLSVLA